MREILFRGFHEMKCGNQFITFNGNKTIGEWVLGYIGAKDVIRKIVDRTIDFDETCVIPETLTQFTGLLDKTGRRIFDGDIVLGWRGYVPSDGYMRNDYPDRINVICVVEFNVGSFCKLKEIRPADEHVDAAKMYNYRLNGTTLNPLRSGGHRYYNPVTKKHDIEGDDMTCPDVEIIGNIYENPEMIAPLE